MTNIVDAVYEDGFLKPAEPLPWKDGERVRIAVSSLESPLLASYGIMGWTGDAEILERIALDPEFLLEEARLGLVLPLPPTSEEEHEHYR
jgi:predicted DNA-binding antitoxin AbrB/MazE fold protein